VFLYRAGGKLRRLTLGSYPDLGLAEARDKARDALQGTSIGRDVAAEQRAAKIRTFESLAAVYLEKHAKRKKRSWRDDARMIRIELAGWSQRPVASIRRVDVRELLDAIVERGAPVLANRVLALVRKMLNFAVDQEWIDANPAAKLARPTVEQARSRVLTDDELRAVLAYLDEPAPEALDAPEQRQWTLTLAALRLRLITAQRGGEVLSMRWQDVEADVWTIPAEHVKNKLPHRVPLTTAATELLADLRPATAAPDAFVFAGIRGTRQRRGALAGLEVENVRPHDFRRTAASRMASAGVPRLVIAKVLNHVDKGITAVYDRHSYDLEKRQALETWARTLQAIETGKLAKVLPMRGRRA
jgi:integrase